jgi:hypothetical protein
MKRMAVSVLVILKNCMSRLQAVVWISITEALFTKFADHYETSMTTNLICNSNIYSKKEDFLNVYNHLYNLQQKVDVCESLFRQTCLS